MLKGWRKSNLFYHTRAKIKTKIIKVKRIKTTKNNRRSCCRSRAFSFSELCSIGLIVFGVTSAFGYEGRRPEHIQPKTFVATSSVLKLRQRRVVVAMSDEHFSQSCSDHCLREKSLKHRFRNKNTEHGF